jgi:hypothetical protein
MDSLYSLRGYLCMYIHNKGSKCIPAQLSVLVDLVEIEPITDIGLDTVEFVSKFPAR